MKHRKHRYTFCGKTHKPNPDGDTVFVCIRAPHRSHGQGRQHHFVSADDPRAAALAS